MKQWILTTLLLITVSGVLSAQSRTYRRLDSLFNTLDSTGKSMGCIVISRDGKVIFSRPIGYRALDMKDPMPTTRATKYKVGAVSKLFTACLVFHLIETGRLKLTSTMDKYFPHLPGAQTMTVGMMLGHRSGLHNLYNETDSRRWNKTPRTEDEVISMISDNPLDYEPDAQASFSSSNYIMLGYLVEQKYKRLYSKIVKDHVISRVDMKRTSVATATTNVNRGESYSYTYRQTWTREPDADMNMLGGAGCIVSTPSDLVKFIEALFAHRLVNKKHLANMQEVKDGFGLGFLPFTLGMHTAFGQSSSIDGYNTVLEYFPDYKLAVCYCSNGTITPVADIVNTAMSIVFDP